MIQPRFPEFWPVLRNFLSGYTYYATNNDFNLQDFNEHFNLPKSASTKTFDIDIANDPEIGNKIAELKKQLKWKR